MGDDHPLDRESGHGLERREQTVRVRLVHEHVQLPARSAQHVPADERRVLAYQEQNLLGLAVKLECFDALRHVVVVEGFGRRFHRAFGGAHTEAP